MANRDDERHASRKIAALIRAEIEEGTKYSPGAQLPSYRVLAAEHGVAQNTAQKAVQLLQAEGLVEIRAQSGAYVRARPSAEPGSEPPLRVELAELQAKLHRTREELADAEQAVADLLERLPIERPIQ